MQNIRIGIIGLGNLGSSFLKSFIRNGYSSRLMVSDLDKNKILYPIHNNEEVIENSDMLFLTVKPNIVKDVLEEIHDAGDVDKLVISTAAGVPIEYIEEKLDSDYYPIIRCMPNLAIEMGKGTIPYYANENTNSLHLHRFNLLLQGNYLKPMAEEKHLDTTTLLTGCMPGFASLIAKTYIQFGVDAGLSEIESANLYASALQGTAELLKHKDPATIIREVSSPGGATEQGINMMRDLDIENIISKSLSHAYSHINSIRKNLD